MKSLSKTKRAGACTIRIVIIIIFFLTKAAHFLPLLFSEPGLCNFFHLFGDDERNKTENIMGRKELGIVKNQPEIFRKSPEMFRYALDLFF